MENIPGVMVESLKDNGCRINFMDKVFSLGLMEEVIRDHMRMTLKVAMEFIVGQMERNLKANGKMEIKMEKVYSPIHKVSQEREFGKMVKD